MELVEERTTSAAFAAAQAQPGCSQALLPRAPSKDRALEEVINCFTTKVWPPLPVTETSPTTMLGDIILAKTRLSKAC